MIRFPRYLCTLLFMLLLLPCPSEAQKIREIEANDQDNEAMVVVPGNSVDGSWSYARSKETRRGTDRDDSVSNRCESKSKVEKDYLCSPWRVGLIQVVQIVK
jgi:hypothetical protein